jgi:hypothetical protein
MIRARFDRLEKVGLHAVVRVFIVRIRGHFAHGNRRGLLDALPEALHAAGEMTAAIHLFLISMDFFIVINAEIFDSQATNPLLS